jgi:alkanesulfonate monooxygenase SsuD/methylene tetrahydromethanopterin reductase-like flavin-dependent oxidoreductase (luciferase family)
VVGGPVTIREGMREFVRRTGADELMVTAQVFDHGARLRSFEILAEAAADPEPARDTGALRQPA